METGNGRAEGTGSVGGQIFRTWLASVLDMTSGIAFGPEVIFRKLEGKIPEVDAGASGNATSGNGRCNIAHWK